VVLPDEPVVQLERLVGEAGPGFQKEGDQRGVATLRGEALRELRRVTRPFTSQAGLTDLARHVGVEPESTDRLELSRQGQEGCGRRTAGRLTQGRQRRDPPARGNDEQGIELGPLGVSESRGQPDEDETLRAAPRLPG